MTVANGWQPDTKGDAVAALRARPIGVWTSTFDLLPAARPLDIAAELDELGFGSLWFGEAYGRESLTLASVLLAATKRAVIGTGIANIYARGAMATSAAARLNAALAPGRFVLGLGVSHQPLVERDRGEQYRPPLQAMRRYLDALEAAPYLGPDEVRPPVVLAALGPKMLDLAAARTAGAHPYLVTPEHTAQARERLGPDALLVVEQAVALVDDPDEAMRRAHEHLSIYTGLPNYTANWRRLGFSDDDFIRGGSERLARALVAMGDTEAIADRTREHLDAGADHVCLQALGTSLTDVPEAAWLELAATLPT